MKAMPNQSSFYLDMYWIKVKVLTSKYSQLAISCSASYILRFLQGDLFFFFLSGNNISAKLKLWRISMKYTLAQGDDLYIFVLTALREKERDIYILKEFQFFWSSKISIFWLLTLLVGSKVKRDSNTFDKFFITSHVFLLIYWESIRECFSFQQHHLFSTPL